MTRQAQAGQGRYPGKIGGGGAAWGSFGIWLFGAAAVTRNLFYYAAFIT